jgi:hypothetical protein
MEQWLEGLGSSWVGVFVRYVMETPNPPVNADARGRAAICGVRRARAGYRAR